MSVSSILTRRSIFTSRCLGVFPSKISTGSTLITKTEICVAKNTDAVVNRKGQGLAEVTIKDLLDAGAHFGHQRRRWNPKMKRFIFEARNDVYIIDLAKTLYQIRKGAELAREIVASGKSVLFVGTKKQAKEVMKECAEACGEFFVTERWLGGMLTNLATIRRSVKKLEDIEKQVSSEAGTQTKKELSLLNKAHTKLDKNLSGIRSMRRPPGLLFVVDPEKEHIAVAEANKLGIPVMALVDTNCNPDPIQHVIPCNDDALKSIKLVAVAISDAIQEAKQNLRVTLDKGDEEEQTEDKPRRHTRMKDDEDATSSEKK